MAVPFGSAISTGATMYYAGISGRRMHIIRLMYTWKKLRAPTIADYPRHLDWNRKLLNSEASFKNNEQHYNIFVEPPKEHFCQKIV